MRRFVVLAIVILNLGFFCPCQAVQLNRAQVPLHEGKSPAARHVAAQPEHKQRPVQISVENIFIDKIEDGAIYSRDGRKFETGGAKVIDNHRKATKTKAAELFLQNGNVVEVILK